MKPQRSPLPFSHSLFLFTLPLVSRCTLPPHPGRCLPLLLVFPPQSSSLLTHDPFVAFSISNLYFSRRYCSSPFWCCLIERRCPFLNTSATCSSLCFSGARQGAKVFPWQRRGRTGNNIPVGLSLFLLDLRSFDRSHMPSRAFSSQILNEIKMDDFEIDCFARPPFACPGHAL